MLPLSHMVASPPVPADADGARILYIGHLNFDCIEDTIIGTPPDLALNLPSRPTVIAWGQRTGSMPPCPGDSSRFYQEGAHASKAVQRTRILYPAWKDLHCSVAFQEMSGDSLPDILLYLRGTALASGIDHDTARAIVLFSQRWLDTVATVDLGSLAPFQYERFFALDLRYGRDIVEPEVRDLSGMRSYRLLPVALMNVRPDSATPRSVHTTAPLLELHVHPNPAVESAQVEARSIPPGEYAVEIVSVNGEVQRRQDVTVSASKHLLRTLDLHALTSGYYVVRLHQQGQLRAVYPIIITH